MRVGIVGLGLIGGSMAKAIKTHTEHTVLGMDRDLTVMLKARLQEAIDDELTPDLLATCDLVLVALYPKDAIAFVREQAGNFKRGGTLIDLCGVKEVVFQPILEVANANGFTYIGGHPMAGREFSGFVHSKGNLFDGASMILVPVVGTPIEVVQQAKQFFLHIGFSLVQISTPAGHDRMIAFTSQLAHVVSSAYIKSPTALEHVGFSAGSFKDMTRVAKLNETMWTELFLENRQYLCREIEMLIGHLQEFHEAIDSSDQDRLFSLLKEGRERKAVVDGETHEDL